MRKYHTTQIIQDLEYLTILYNHTLSTNMYSQFIGFQVRINPTLEAMEVIEATNTMEDLSKLLL
jgi:hypothetical protein